MEEGDGGFEFRVSGFVFQAYVSNEIYRQIEKCRGGVTPPLKAPNRIKAIRCPMPGIVVAVGVKEGDRVKKGDSLLIIEAMKMENEIKAPYNGVIKQINVTQGSMVKLNDELIIIGDRS